MSRTSRVFALAALSTVAMAAVALTSPGLAGASVGSFAASDPLLNEIWAASVRTAADAVIAGPLQLDALERPCAIGFRR